MIVFPAVRGSASLFPRHSTGCIRFPPAVTEENLRGITGIGFFYTLDIFRSTQSVITVAKAKHCWEYKALTAADGTAFSFCHPQPDRGEGCSTYAGFPLSGPNRQLVGS